jgi:glycosyltransferase involved in cell wall biosynthesis
MKKRVLWVTDETPDPDLGGGSIRQYQLLRRLNAHADIDLLMVGQLRNSELRESLHRVVELAPPKKPPPWRQWIIDRQTAFPGRLPTEIRLARPKVELLRPHLANHAAYDILQVEHSALASLIPESRSQGGSIITLHNLISVRMRQLAEVSTKARVRWLLLRDAERAKRLERWIVNNYAQTIVVSEGDAREVGGHAIVVPNGVDLDRFAPSKLPSAHRLIFIATFSYGPNIDGARWLCTEVFPRVRAQLHDAVLSLVGREPHVEVRALARLPGVEAHFDVPSVLPYLQSARVALAPLRAGSGTRLKVLEAMAAGRPVAGTAIGVEGLGLCDGHSAAVADDPRALGERIIRLCRDDTYAGHLTGVARRLVEERFGWDAIADRYVDQLLSS